MLERLWAGWRMAHIGAEPASSDQVPGDGQTLFESIFHSGRPDQETFIVWRGQTCFALLNLYPYTSGHLMVLPQRGVPKLTDLTDEEYHELWQGVRMGVTAVEAAYRPEGVNVGANLGRGAGAGIPDHLHVHVVPRWAGDTNFMTTVADARVVPEALSESWRRLVEAWPVA
jgi:ATP adenylyltransferase